MGLKKIQDRFLKPTAPRFSINFERLFGKILPLYLAYCKKFCQKTSQNLWKSEARWVLRQALCTHLTQISHHKTFENAK
ncbi:MAG: hypothetical protein A3D15_02920 [Alphaproteobacteria bacterium RIFCSPHIGHO2_02_FULL_40_34]|nr:MAG: hypothetical protein A3D15_02920 [Alphaproteobacteria bacterium RIFCSPHIGHO2_02_FULL_40_34]OFX10399.1 MAG: hypothetical protein A3H30_03145 [Alphaproteobacteria bacterium RIFCSPLOWO2_02_FULL_40_19]